MHDEPCRFFRNSDRVDTVRFYEALANAPTLPFFSVVYCAQNDDVSWPFDTVGTVNQRPFTFTGRVSPPGLAFDHICGTADDWRLGAIYDPLAQPIPVGANGLPLCCDPPKRVAGGAGGGGLSRLVVVHPLALGSGAGAGGMAYVDIGLNIDPAEGGLELGGAAGDSFTQSDATEGGLELGGTVGDVFSPNDPPAGGLELGGTVGDLYTGTDPPAGGLELGGTVGDVFSPNDPPAGGLELGGTVGDVFTPPPPAIRDVTSGSVSFANFTAPMTVVNDFLVCVVGCGSTAPTPNAGWTLASFSPEVTGGTGIAVFVRVSTGMAGQPCAPTSMSYVYYSVQNASAVDVQQTGNSAGAASTNAIAPTITLGHRDMTFFAWGWGAAPGTITFPGGLTINGAASFTTLSVGRALFSAGATGTQTAHTSNSVRWSTLSIGVF